MKASIPWRKPPHKFEGFDSRSGTGMHSTSEWYYHIFWSSMIPPTTSEGLARLLFRPQTWGLEPYDQRVPVASLKHFRPYRRIRGGGSKSLKVFPPTQRKSMKTILDPQCWKQFFWPKPEQHLKSKVQSLQCHFLPNMFGKYQALCKKKQAQNCYSVDPLRFLFVWFFS